MALNDSSRPRRRTASGIVVGMSVALFTIASLTGCTSALEPTTGVTAPDTPAPAVTARQPVLDPEKLQDVFAVPVVGYGNNGDSINTDNWAPPTPTETDSLQACSDEAIWAAMGSSVQMQSVKSDNGSGVLLAFADAASAEQTLTTYQNAFTSCTRFSSILEGINLGYWRTYAFSGGGSLTELRYGNVVALLNDTKHVAYGPELLEGLEASIDQLAS